jgi:hypothetical protein
MGGAEGSGCSGGEGGLIADMLTLHQAVQSLQPWSTSALSRGLHLVFFMGSV